MGSPGSARRVALDLYPAGRTAPFLDFAAPAAPGNVKGSILVPVTADRMLVAATLEYRATAGKQKPERFEGGERDVLLSSLTGGAAEQSGLTLTATQINEEAVETKTIF